MKKIGLFLFALALLLSLVSCGGNSEPGEMTERATRPAETEAGETVSDQTETEASDLSREEDTNDGYGEFIPF